MSDNPGGTVEETLDVLEWPERFLLQSLRAWACCCRARRPPAEPVRLAFAALGIPAGAEALDAAMTRLVLDALRPLAVHRPPHGDVTPGESRLLAAAAAAQENDVHRACLLLAGVVPGNSAAAAVGSLTRLGLQLAVAGLPLCAGAAGPPPRPTLH